MATKKTEKVAAKSAPKKSPAPKKSKSKKAGGPVIINEKAEVRLVQFSIKAVIPVQAYGNMQPEIVVTAPSIEEATAYALPIMEGLYQQYAEIPTGMKAPSFFKKESVTVTEKFVPQEEDVRKNSTPATQAPLPGAQPQATNQAPKQEEKEAPVEKSAGVLKAEGMIKGAMSIEALDVIEQKIKDSVKMDSVEKDHLYTVVLTRRAELKK